MDNIYLISDTHFGHENIIKHCKRPFDNAKQMNQYMIDRWNSVIKKGSEEIWHLGDFTFDYKHDRVYDLISKLYGFRKLIIGNHDNSNHIKCLRKCGIEVMYYDVIKLNNKKISLYHFPIKNYHGHYLIHGHIHNNNGVRKNCFNVSVENINYTPIKLIEVYDKLKQNLEI